MTGGTEPAAIAFRGVAKRYGRRRVLSSLDFEVRPGECFGLVGVNGAGKTTALKALLDFTDVDAGEIRIFGRSHHQSAARERLAFLPEQFLPPYYLRGRDFLGYMSSLHGAPYPEDGVAGMCAALDLDREALARPVRQYSKGMAQKLGLAACFLSGKDLLVLDEPMSGLDPKARLLVKRLLVRLRAEGRTLFFNTHLLADVEEVCDRMGVLHGGRLRFTGTPPECRKRHGAETLEEAYLTCISGEDDRPG